MSVDIAPTKPGTGFEPSSQPSSSKSIIGWLRDNLTLRTVRNLLSFKRSNDSNDHNTDDSVAYRIASSSSMSCSISTEGTNDSGSEESEDWCSPVDWQYHLILEAVMTGTSFPQFQTCGAADGSCS